MTEPQSKMRVFWGRLLSSSILWGAVIAAALWQSTTLLFILALTLALLALWEYFDILKERQIDAQRWWVVAMTGLIYTVVWGGHYWSCELGSISSEMAVLSLFLLGSFALKLGKSIERPQTFVSVAASWFGFFYISVLFLFTGKIAFWVENMVSAKAAILTVFFLLIVTKFSDMGAYLVGSLIGKHRMIAHISPNKTWEGLGGAIAFSTGGGFLFWRIFASEMPFLGAWHVAILGVLLGGVAVVGDLAESMFKRSLEVKDSGRMLPGIGGALDLVDSLLFTAPVLYFYLQVVAS